MEGKVGEEGQKFGERGRDTKRGEGAWVGKETSKGQAKEDGMDIRQQ